MRFVLLLSLLPATTALLDEFGFHTMPDGSLMHNSDMKYATATLDLSEEGVPEVQDRMQDGLDDFLAENLVDTEVPCMINPCKQVCKNVTKDAIVGSITAPAIVLPRQARSKAYYQLCAPDAQCLASNVKCRASIKMQEDESQAKLDKALKAYAANRDSTRGKASKSGVNYKMSWGARRRRRRAAARKPAPPAHGHRPAPPAHRHTPAAGDIVERVPDMSPADVQKVMNWIKVKTTEERLPFCWRQSYGRGVGTIPGRVADCEAGYVNHGATCHRPARSIGAGSRVASCPSGYTNMGLTCYRGPHTFGKCCTTVWSKCPCNRAGYTNFGCTCTRGAHSMGMGSMKCPHGYFQSKITARCHKNCPPGYSNTGETCYRGPVTKGIGSMRCKSNEKRILARCFPKTGSCFGGGEKQAGLCYKRCRAGFHGVGPVCWQDCTTGWTGCGAGCAKSKTECGMVIVDQVIAPLVLAANIATMGMSTGATAGAKAAGQTIKIAGKTVAGTGKVGKALVKAVKTLQTVKKFSKATTTVSRTVFSSTKVAKVIKVVKYTAKVTAKAYAAAKDYAAAVSKDFIKQTSKEISAELDRRFIPETANFLKETWGRGQLAEMAEANHWNIAQNALSVVAIVDVTGVTGVVAAYAKPVCKDKIKLPCLRTAMKDTAGLC